MKLCLVLSLLVTAARGRETDANPADILQVYRSKRKDHTALLDTTRAEESVRPRRLGGSETLQSEDNSATHRRLGAPENGHGKPLSKEEVAQMVAGLTPNPAQSKDIFSGATNEHEDDKLCDYCSQDGWFRKHTPLEGNKFSVKVTRTQGDYNAMVAFCIAPEFGETTCIYSPNNEEAEYIRLDANKTEAYGKCTDDFKSNNCCNYVYSREKSEFRDFLGNEGCSPETCKFVERICYSDSEETFSCPIGSKMAIYSIGAFQVDTADTNAVLATATYPQCTFTNPDPVTGIGNSVKCTATALVQVTADDCSCAHYNLANGKVEMGRCSVPVDGSWLAEGRCAEPDHLYCDRRNTPPVVKIEAPKRGQTFQENQVISVLAIVQDFEDNHFPDRVYWLLNGEIQTVTNAKDLFIRPNLLLPGDHVLAVAAIDSRGELTFDSVSFTVEAANATDYLPPIRIEKPLDKHLRRYSHNESIPLHVVAANADTTLDDTEIVWFVDNLPTAKRAKNFLAAGELAYGYHKIAVVVTSSNWTADASVEIFVWIDSPPPRALIVADPEKTEFKATETFTLEPFLRVDPSRFVDQFDWYLNGDLQSVTTSFVEVDLGDENSSFKDGKNTIELIVADTEGIASERATFNFTVIGGFEREQEEQDPFPECPFDDGTWYVTRGGQERKCDWVAENAIRRCRFRGVDGRPAYEGCPGVCGDDSTWKIVVKQEEVGCEWAEKNPMYRCSFRGIDGRRASKACAVTCCGSNRAKASNSPISKEVFLGKQLYEDNEDFSGSVNYRRPPCLVCGLGRPR